MAEQHITNADVRRLHEVEITERLGLQEVPEFISWRAPSWVSKSRNAAGAVAIKTVHSLNPEVLFAETQQQVHTLQHVRANGGNVINFLEEPWLEKPQDLPGAFTCTVSELLPESHVDTGEYAGAIGSMHIASKRVDLTRVRLVDPLESIGNMKNTLRHLRSLRKQGKHFQTGDTRISYAQHDRIEQVVAETYQLRGQWCSLAKENGSPLVLVQEDVRIDNAGKDVHGTPTILDIDPQIGPAAIDFGRVINDWPRFKNAARAAQVETYLAAYEEATGALPPTEELELAARFSNHRSSVVQTGMVVSGVMDGHPGYEWLLNESLYRLTVIDEPDAPWHADDSARRAQEIPFNV